MSTVAADKTPEMEMKDIESKMSPEMEIEKTSTATEDPVVVQRRRFLWGIAIAFVSFITFDIAFYALNDKGFSVNTAVLALDSTDADAELKISGSLKMSSFVNSYDLHDGVCHYYYVGEDKENYVGDVYGEITPMSGNNDAVSMNFQLTNVEYDAFREMLQSAVNGGDGRVKLTCNANVQVNLFTVIPIAMNYSPKMDDIKFSDYFTESNTDVKSSPSAASVHFASQHELTVGGKVRMNGVPMGADSFVVQIPGTRYSASTVADYKQNRFDVSTKPFTASMQAGDSKMDFRTAMKYECVSVEEKACSQYSGPAHAVQVVSYFNML